MKIEEKEKDKKGRFGSLHFVCKMHRWLVQFSEK